MKPCLRYRRQIALLVLDALDVPDATTLRDHLTMCAACRNYRNEIAAVSRTLSSATPSSNLEPSASFYHCLLRKLQRVEPTLGLAELLSQLSASVWKWRLSLSAGASFVAVALLVALRHLPPASGSPPTTSLTASQPASQADPPPTIAVYQIAASQSLQSFSDLLRKEGEKPLPRVPTYSISSFEQANRPF